jgi:VanZ family protein
MKKLKVTIYSISSLAYMGLIFYLSSIPTEIKLSSFSAFDKLSHMIAYGILASLIYLTLKEMNVRGRHLLALAFGISFLYGVSNEINQYFLSWRDADGLDVVANGVGAFSFLTVLRYRASYQNR